MSLSPWVRGLVLLSVLATVRALPAEPAATPGDRSIFAGMPAELRSRYEASAIRLWEQRAPAARSDSDADVPRLYPVPGGGAARSARPAILVLPGGGYTYHSAAEAFPIAAWFRDAGFAAFVLQYRLRPYGPEVSLLDAQRAVRLLRQRAAEFQLDPDRIAVIGFSAGGHLAANLSTHGDDGTTTAPDSVDRLGCRIQSAVLFYPGILHGRLDHATPGGREIASVLSLDGLHHSVDAHTPPTFLIVGYDDTRVPYEHCLAYAAGLHRAAVRFELHVLGAGEHGGSVRDGRRALWQPAVLEWLSTCGFTFGR
jgi:acetyl esterase/lipase